MSKIKFDKELITKLMWTQSLESIAKTYYGCSSRTLYRFCKAEDITVPTTAEKTKRKIEKFFEENDRKLLPKSIKDLADIIGVSHVPLRAYVDKAKISDLKRAEEVLKRIKANPNYKWNDGVMEFTTRKIIRMSLAQDRVSKVINLIIKLKNNYIVLKNYDTIDEFEKAFKNLK